MVEDIKSVRMVNKVNFSRLVVELFIGKNYILIAYVQVKIVIYILERFACVDHSIFC